MIKKVIVGVFAHPDDETFGPSGIIAKLAKKNDVYILCATSGQQGENHRHRTKRPLWMIRRHELRQAAKILGVKKVYFLGFEDGTLCNNLYQEIAAKVEKKLKQLKADEIITYYYTGVSGHIDHITMSMISNFVFQRLPRIKKLMMSGILKERAAERQDYFVYFPPGFEESEFDLVVDVSDVWNIKVEAMKQHKTQLKDMQNILQQSERLHKKEYFFVKEK